MSVTESPLCLDKSCYLFDNLRVSQNWNSVQYVCETYFHGGLLELNSAKEFDFITTMLINQETSRYIWLGCKNRPEEKDKIICENSDMFWNLRSDDHAGYWADGIHGMYLRTMWLLMQAVIGSLTSIK